MGTFREPRSTNCSFLLEVNLVIEDISASFIFNLALILYSIGIAIAYFPIHFLTNMHLICKQVAIRGVLLTEIKQRRRLW